MIPSATQAPTRTSKQRLQLPTRAGDAFIAVWRRHEGDGAGDEPDALPGLVSAATRCCLRLLCLAGELGPAATDPPAADGVALRLHAGRLKPKPSQVTPLGQQPLKQLFVNGL